jgi:hypothetical protein
MTDHITLRRADAEQIRAALVSGKKLFAALAALDAALAEPDATREPATDAEIVNTAADCAQDPEYLLDFNDGWRAAERFHGITKEDK